MNFFYKSACTVGIQFQNNHSISIIIIEQGWEKYHDLSLGSRSSA